MLKQSLCLLSIVFLFSCKKDNSNVPVITTGKITGSVTLYNERSNTLSSSEGMTVSIDGTILSTVTNASGSYQFENIPNDIYNLTFSKPGFGTFKLFGFSHTGTGNNSSIVPGKSLGQLSTTTIVSQSATLRGDSVQISATISPAATSAARRGVRIFFDNSAAVSSSTYKNFSQVYFTSNVPSVLFSKEDLYAMGFAAGSTVYARVYGDSFFANDYEEVSTGATVFPNLNTNSSAAVSFTLP